MTNNGNFNLYWNRSIITDTTVTSNRPDITFINKTTKNTFLIDIAVPNTQSRQNNNLKTRKIPRAGE
jgi:hypothetical protein